MRPVPGRLQALSRKQDRLHSLEFGTPPEFAEPIIKAEDAGDGMVWVYKAFGWGQTQRYLVKKESEEWKIDTKEDEGSGAGKWLKRPNL